MPGVPNSQNLKFDEIQQSLAGSTDRQLRADAGGDLRSKDHSQSFFGRFMGRSDKFNEAARQVVDALEKSVGHNISDELKKQIRDGVAGKTHKPVGDMLKDIRHAWHHEAAEQILSQASYDTRYQPVEQVSPLRPEGKALIEAHVKSKVDAAIRLAETQGKTLELKELNEIATLAFDAKALEVKTAMMQVTAVTELQHGQKGQVYKVAYGDGATTVVKIQEDDPAAAIAATRILQEAGANTPALQKHDAPGRGSLITGLHMAEDGSPARAKLLAALEQAGDKFVVEMPFATGQTLGAKLAGPDAKAMLTNPAFQSQLGVILAADAFTGNPDRAYAYNSGGKLQGWFNDGNLLVEGTGNDLKVTAIDNDLSTGSNVVFGRLEGSRGVLVHGSLAAMQPAEFKKEVGALVDLMVKEANKTANPAIALAPAEKQAFVDRVNQSAQSTLDQLLQHGMNRKDMLEAAGVGNDLRGSFSEHKRAMRLLRGEGDGINPAKPTVSVKDALQMAKSRDDYRKHMGKEESHGGPKL